jgi:2-amino-4-hydroxy-6-hydroxymethyldihydropteridine diphosphokinase
MQTSYAIALGSNMRHGVYGRPEQVLKAALLAIDRGPTALVAQSRTLQSRPIGPSQRSYCNAVAIIETALDPPALLAHFKQIEGQFGRRSAGQRWRARVLDLDIILWSGGIWAEGDLMVPHVAFRTRGFVLLPLRQIARDWRDPVSGRSVAQLAALLPKSSAF